MRSRLFWGSTLAGGLSWMAELARAGIEKIVVERIVTERARTASSDFFMGLTSHWISYDVFGGPEILRTFQTLVRDEKLLFLAGGELACDAHSIADPRACFERRQLPSWRSAGQPRAAVPTRPITGQSPSPDEHVTLLRRVWVCGGALGSLLSVDRGRG